MNFTRDRCGLRGADFSQGRPPGLPLESPLRGIFPLKTTGMHFHRFPTVGVGIPMLDPPLRLVHCFLCS